MAFPTNPTDGQVYKNKIWRSSSSTWTDSSAIVESGSNVNGNWIKYSDGTMTQWGIGTWTGSITANTIAETTVTFYHSSTQVHSLPSNFINNSYVVVFNSGQGSYPSTYYTHSYTTASFNYYLWSLHPGDQLSNGIKWIAMGRWK